MNIITICATLVGYVAGHSSSVGYAGPHGGNPYLEARPWQNEHDYVEVRPGAYMFYWLYWADAYNKGAESKPLIIWIQGGPGYAASGVGNFMQIGPLDWKMQPRNHTWVKGRSVLFIDYPVGAGFSFALNDATLVKSEEMMVDDLFKTIKAFFENFKELSNAPTYLFSQRYGGKICPRLAYNLHKAIEEKSLNMSLKGIGIGNAFMDAKESSRWMPEFLFHTGALDRPTYQKSVTFAKNIGRCIDKGEYENAYYLYSNMTNFIQEESGIIHRYKDVNHDKHDALKGLENAINNYVKPSLEGVHGNMHWSPNVPHKVIKNLKADVMIPSTKYLEMLLNETQLNIAVYNGNLDRACPLPGATSWVYKLKWPGAHDFRETSRKVINGQRNGLYKQTGRFSFWWVFKAADWVPEENPEAMEHILEHVISGTNLTTSK